MNILRKAKVSKHTRIIVIRNEATFRRAQSRLAKVLPAASCRAKWNRKTGMGSIFVDRKSRVAARLVLIGVLGY